jgi:hypothetical protein
VLQPRLGDPSDLTPLARSPDGAGQYRGGGLMELHQVLDFLEGETQFLTLFDKPDALKIAVAVRAITGERFWAFAQDSLALVEADGLNIDPSLVCQLANPHDLIVNPIPWYRVNLFKSLV